MSVSVVVLGSCGGYPRAGRACSGYLVRAGSSSVLLDVGNGVLSNLLEFTTVDAVDLIAISHMHPDHFADIFPLFTALRFSFPRPGSIPVMAPRGAFSFVEPLLSGGSKKDFLECFRWLEWEDGRWFQLEDRGKVLDFSTCRRGTGSRSSLDTYRFESRATPVESPSSHLFEISPVQVEHPIDTLGFRIAADGKVICYSGDTDFCDGLLHLAQGADLLICESTFTSEVGMKAGGHLFASEAGRVAACAGARRLLLAHIWPTFDEETALCDAMSEFHGEILLAREKMVIEL